VIETIGKKITELTPSRGFAAEFGAATTIVLASRLGLPISATHTLVGAVLGVGLARGLEAVNLNTTRDILVSWVVTVPIGAALALALFFPIRAIFG
jgi:PiT family inorganic phosphate transporter